ncbi:MAG: hypothetical protein KME27_26575 [Lyngbya sp. HA4199-MV5]|jgi:hypothetical protein|nr:hypothetical protein [Lyngbya sp. HA4199-MV5]
MKFMISSGCFILLTAILPAVSGNTQTEPRSQPSPQPTCVATKPLKQSTITVEQPITQNSGQGQQRSECALNQQPQTVRVEPQLLERDRLTKERFEQRIIPPQD